MPPEDPRQLESDASLWRRRTNSALTGVVVVAPLPATIEAKIVFAPSQLKLSSAR